MQGSIPQGWKRRHFGEFLKESRLPGTTGADAEKLTVKLYGKGVIAKEERVAGSANTKYYRRRAGQFIYSRLDFLNGAFGLVPEELDGRESTADLPAFDIAEDVVPTWLLAYVTQPTFYETQRSASSGSRKARRVAPGEFLRLEVLVPPYPEQKKMAAILESVDDAIRATQAVVNQTRRVKDGLLRELLTRGIGPDGQPHTRLKHTEIGEIPEGWQLLSAEHVAEAEGMVGGPFGSDLTADDYSEYGVPIIRGANISPDGFREEDFVFVTDEKAQTLRRNEAIRGDIVMTQRGVSLGEAALIPDDSAFSSYIISQTMMRMRANQVLIHAEFGLLVMQSPFGQGWLHAHAIGTGQPHLNLGIWRKMPFPTPPIPEQARIIERVRAVDRAQRASQRTLQGVRLLKSALLHDLLTGRVRVTP